MKDLKLKFKSWWDLKSKNIKIIFVSSVVVIAGGIVAIPVTLSLVNKDKEPTLLMWVPWYDGQIHIDAINEIVDMYNSNNENHYDIELAYQDNYQNIIDRFYNYLKAGKELPNLYIAYPAATAILQDNLLDPTNPTFGTLALPLEQKGVFGEDNIPVERNSQSLNSLGYKEGTLFNLPLTGDTESLSLNSILYVHFIKEFIDLGGLVNFEDDTDYIILRQLIDAADGTKDGYLGDPDSGVLLHLLFGSKASDSDPLLINSSTDIENLINQVYPLIDARDMQTISNQWDGFTKSTSVTDTINLGDWIFQDYIQLYDLGVTLFDSLYPNLYDQGANPKEYSPLGFLDPDNQFYLMSQMWGGAYSQFENSLAYLDRNSTIGDTSDDFINYTILDIENQDNLDKTIGYQSSEEAFNYIYNGIKDGYLWTPSSDAVFQFNMGFFSMHQSLATTSNTAATRYYYDPEGKQEYLNRGEVVWLSAPSTLGSDTSLDGNGVPTQTEITTQLEWDEATKLHHNQSPGIGAINKGDFYVNEEETIFLEWIFGVEKIQWDENLPAMTPTEYFSYKANYVSGTSSVVTNDPLNPSYIEQKVSENHLASGTWIGDDWNEGVSNENGDPIEDEFISPTITMDNFSEANEDPNVFLSNEAVGPNTASFKNQILTEMINWKNNADNMPSSMNEWIFDTGENYNGLRDWAIINEVIKLNDNLLIKSQQSLVQNKSLKNKK